MSTFPLENITVDGGTGGYEDGEEGTIYLGQGGSIPGGLNGDACVDQADLGILLADWSCTGGGRPGDGDGDGDTDQADLGILLAHWGEGCP